MHLKQYNYRDLNSNTRMDENCVVGSHLAFVLFVSRLLGIAPVSIRKQNGNYTVRVSRPYVIYGKFFGAIFNFTFLNDLCFGMLLFMVDLIIYRTVLLLSDISSTLNALNKSLYDFSCSIVQTAFKSKYFIDATLWFVMQASKIIAITEQCHKAQQENIEVVGVTESKDEDTTDIVLKLAKKIGISIQSDDVEFAHRVQARRTSNAAKGCTIIARFRHHRTKDAIICSKNRNIKPSVVGIRGEVSLCAMSNTKALVREFLFSDMTLQKPFRNELLQLYDLVSTQSIEFQVLGTWELSRSTVITGPSAFETAYSF
ncbi:unnamed protein product [Leptidea sinapis]|uniref:Uncharacterized protein n=1 Tax=Leptidea sinapis TaxID=189913 RepID=A0A5E4R108_9NEOP|nr:unnamed protein product [Leptidea sinapis]